MSDDWFDRNRRELGEEDPPEEQGEHEEPEVGWDTPARWPVPERPTSEESGPDPVWEYTHHAEPPREAYSEQAREVGYDHRSRDPLARLFPGLPRTVRVTLDWILTIAGAILIVLALKQWVVNPYRIPSSSMEPTLNCAQGPTEPGCLGHSSDRVLACRICLRFGPPSRGDIVVFNTPRAAALKCGEGGTFVKRVIGLPGDTVREDDNGFIDIKSQGSQAFVRLKEPYLTADKRLADSTHFGQIWHVPEGDYFMMGDNRSESCDSRTWGSVPRNKLIGTVFFVYWPPDRIGFR
ncbi:MAG TPA: signal peptidase I [Gaiellaceae bacterium]|nr:signal peptidase I [Gaiellaceae bacterium]